MTTAVARKKVTRAEVGSWLRLGGVIALPPWLLGWPGGATGRAMWR